LEIPQQFHVHETNEWLVNHRMNSALPGYLMVGSKRFTTELSGLPTAALLELGPLLAKTQQVLEKKLGAKRVYIGRYGHTPGFSLHFHIIPIFEWVERLFLQDTRYRALEAFCDPGIEPSPDGVELTLFVWREFCERADPPQIEGPSVESVIATLKKAMLDF
jgi:diadenosine tetraphosphate (Ap4A) HIT family hydrolase